MLAHAPPMQFAQGSGSCRVRVSVLGGAACTSKKKRCRGCPPSWRIVAPSQNHDSPELRTPRLRAPSHVASLRLRHPLRAGTGMQPLRLRARRHGAAGPHDAVFAGFACAQHTRLAAALGPCPPWTSTRTTCPAPTWRCVRFHAMLISPTLGCLFRHCSRAAQ